MNISNHKTKGINLFNLECKNKERIISLNEKFVSNHDTYILGSFPYNIACVWFDQNNSKIHSATTPSLIYRNIEVTIKET